MKTVVMKFGGTSVADVSRIRHVATLVARFKRENPGVIPAVVVSAMAGETNRLIALARTAAREPDPRELDVLVATGEQVTVALLSMILREGGVPAQSFLATQARILTDGHHTNAQIVGIEGRDLTAVIKRGIVPVVAGFQGISDEGDLTTLGRGGSDITAVALAAELKARACYIYTDVDGVYSTDPRICPRARRLARVTYEEMLELASLGAKVLHPRSVYMAMRYQVPLCTLSTFSAEGGTWIVATEGGMERAEVTGITYRTDEAKLTLVRVPRAVNSLQRIFAALSERNLFIDMISQAGYSDGTANISITVPDESSSSALEVAQVLAAELGAEGAELDRNIAKVSVVGLGIRYSTGIAARMFNALSRAHIDIEMVGATDIKISILVHRKYGEAAVRALHGEFIESQPRISSEAFVSLPPEGASSPLGTSPLQGELPKGSGQAHVR